SIGYLYTLFIVKLKSKFHPYVDTDVHERDQQNAARIVGTSNVELEESPIPASASNDHMRGGHLRTSGWRWSRSELGDPGRVVAPPPTPSSGYGRVPTSGGPARCAASRRAFAHACRRLDARPSARRGRRWRADAARGLHQRCPDPVHCRLRAARRQALRVA